MRSMVTYERRRRNRDCRPFDLYLKVNISLAKVCCSMVALILAYGIVGLPMIVNFLLPARSTVPKTTFSPASRRCSFSHCTRSPTATLCWCSGLDLKTAKALRVSSLGRSFPSGTSGSSGIGLLCGICRCQMNEQVGFVVGKVLGWGFQCRAMFIFFVLNLEVHCQRSLRSLYVSSSFMF